MDSAVAGFMAVLLLRERDCRFVAGLMGDIQRHISRRYAIYDNV